MRRLTHTPEAAALSWLGPAVPPHCVQSSCELSVISSPGLALQLWFPYLLWVSQCSESVSFSTYKSLCPCSRTVNFDGQGQMADPFRTGVGGGIQPPTPSLTPTHPFPPTHHHFVPFLPSACARERTYTSVNPYLQFLYHGTCFRSGDIFGSSFHLISSFSRVVRRQAKIHRQHLSSRRWAA